MRLSVIIPSYKDPLLQRTIDSLLQQSELGADLEVLPVLDGYWPDPPLRDDDRVRIIHLGKNRGMRGAINYGARLARGDYLLRTDEHATFGPGYDRILCDACQPNWILTPRRYALDPVKWEIMPEIAPVDYMKLKIVHTKEGRKFSGVDWPTRAKERADILVDETPAMQGSCWLMPRAWWDSVIGELQTEGYGPLWQDSHELSFKTWQAGGKLMVVKSTFHAHKHRSFPRTHQGGTPENPSNGAASFAYCLSVWESYYHEEIEPRWKGA